MENSGADAGTHLGIPVPMPELLDGVGQAGGCAQLGAEAKEQSSWPPPGTSGGMQMLVSMTPSHGLAPQIPVKQSPPSGTPAHLPLSLLEAFSTHAPSFISSTNALCSGSGT